MHFTLGGMAAFATAIWAILRVVDRVRAWLEWREKVEIRLAALEHEDVKAMKEELLK